MTFCGISSWEKLATNVCLPDNKPNSGRLRRASFLNTTEDVTENTALLNSSPQILALLIFGHKTTPSIISRFVCGGRLKLLKVLHLEDARLAEFPGDNVTTNLFFLRYLRLDFENTSRVCIPSSLGKLVYLETLDLSNVGRHRVTVELPDEILKLTRLRNLLGDGAGEGLRLPKEIGRLSSLENLEWVNGSDGIDGRELGKLTRLRTLFIKELRGEDATPVLASAIEKMIYLRCLGLEIQKSSRCGFEVENMKQLRPPQFQLQRLYLSGRMKGTPDWILSLDRLLSLSLWGSQIKDESFFNDLQLMLPNLKELSLAVDAIEGAELCFYRESFPKLSFLSILGLTKLRLIKVEEGAMPCILTIRFTECWELENVPTGIEHLTTLETIKLYRISSHFKKALRSHCWKAGHSPPVVTAS